MKKIILVLVVAMLAAAVWRRNEFRNDADRASKAVSGAATAARNKMPSSASESADAVSEAADAMADAADAVADAADEAADAADATS